MIHKRAELIKRKSPLTFRDMHVVSIVSIGAIYAIIYYCEDLDLNFIGNNLNWLGWVI